MTGCSVPQCKNRSENGVRVFYLPLGERNLVRKQAWLTFINRRDVPSRACVCEAHFERSQFECNRQDGRRLLKPNAVPTIPVLDFQNPPLKKKKEDSITEECTNILDHADVTTVTIPVSDCENFPLTKRKEDSTITACTVQIHVDDSVNYADVPTSTEHESFIDNLQFEALQTKLKSAQKKIERLENKLRKIEEKGVLEDTYKTIFNQDQLFFLKNGNHRGVEWSAETINNALKLYMACGAKGYEELRKQNLPFPSIRTLQNRIKNFNFQPGLLQDVFNLLAIKVSTFEVAEKHAALLVDEMAIQPKYQYDSSIQRVIGRPTMSLSGNSAATSAELATHSLVFMLAGLSSRWKQTVSYELTGNSYNAQEAWQKIVDIIKSSTEIGLTVKTLISDMGPQNRAVWRLLNVVAHRHGTIENYCTHPVNSEKKLYVMPDPIHIYKNVGASLLKHKEFLLDKTIVEKYNLPSNTIILKAIEEVYHLEKDNDLKIAYRLKPNIFEPTHFEKMNVNIAFSLFHQDTAAAIKYYILKKKLHPSYETTAWFIQTFFKWFSIMTARSSKLGLSLKNEEMYANTIVFLKDFISIIRGMHIGNRNWQPFQSGLLLATQTALDLQQEYLNDENFKFFLLGRLTQDALENLFSQIRTRTPIPGPFDFKTSLRLITLSQYEANVRNSYLPDCSEALIKYCKDLNPKQFTSDDENYITDIMMYYMDEIESENLTEDYEHCLYYLLGGILHKLQSRGCSSCLLPLQDQSPDSVNRSAVTKVKALFHPLALTLMIKKKKVATALSILNT